MLQLCKNSMHAYMDTPFRVSFDVPINLENLEYTSAVADACKDSTGGNSSCTTDMSSSVFTSKIDRPRS